MAKKQTKVIENDDFVMDEKLCRKDTNELIEALTKFVTVWGYMDVDDPNMTDDMRITHNIAMFCYDVLATAPVPMKDPANYVEPDGLTAELAGADGRVYRHGNSTDALLRFVRAMLKAETGEIDLRALLHQAMIGKSAKEVAEKAGCTQAQVSNYKNGGDIKASTLQKLLQAATA